MLMKRITLIVFYCICFFRNSANAQCNDIGLSPSKAIAVCGDSVFTQTQVFDCINQNVAQNDCPIGVSATRSYWYKFTCFQSGTLGFLMSGLNKEDDYDWVLYDVTGRDPNEIFTNASLVVSMNIYGTDNRNPNPPFPNSPTGCIPGGIGKAHCEGDAPGNTPFNEMPTITQGRQYLLMVANFAGITNSFDGYDLTFGGGTASITDPKLPALYNARAACDGTEITIKLNKKMKCPTLTATGTEFFITPPIANVIAAEAIGCSNSFDMDSLLITLDNPLPPGTYTITIRNGSDGNTLLDICDRPIPNGETIDVTVFPQFPTPMDSITKVIKCAPDEVQLVFRKRMRCNSVAPNGSDFIITGTSPLTILSAAGFKCDAKGLSNIIKVKFTQPIQVKGNFSITLRSGTDGTTIIDECGKESLPNQSLSFSTKDTVNADFTYNIKYGCKRDTIDYRHNGFNEVNMWRWDFDNLRKSTLQNPSTIYATFGQKFTKLIVSNGTCSDTSAVIPIYLKDAVKAKFEAPYVVCPTEKATIVNKSTGGISIYDWDFGNNTFSSLKDPPPVLYNTQRANEYLQIKLIVNNGQGCTDTATQNITVAGICAIKVPTAFTPNGDGLNDFLFPMNAYKAKDLLFRIYNRFGEMIYETADWRKGWNGKYKGQGADPATYVWALDYINIDTGKRVAQRGTSILIR
jgi:gliding motility-associated-like protein